MKHVIFDLRSAIAALQDIPGEYAETDRPVDLFGELTGIYKKLGAHGTVRRPTRLGPMMMFTNIKGYPGARVAIGVVGTRERAGFLLGAPPDKLGAFFIDSLANVVAPVSIPGDRALCREEVHLATDPDFDIRKLLAAPFTTVKDAGPYITMGLCYASDPDNSDDKNAAIHRMCIQGNDELTIGFGGHRHLAVFRDKAFAKGEGLPVSVNIGLDPAVYLTSCFEPPTTPLGFNELAIAGAVRRRPVEMTRCLTINEDCIANAEIVIEGEIVPDYQLKEDSTTNSGRALPEFPGYSGPAQMNHVIKVKAVTCRKNPIMQICIGSSEEHVIMAGIPNEASIMRFMNDSMPGKVLNVYCPPSGGGKFNAIMQFKKTSKADEGKQRQAALGALAILPELKNVYLVDEDVDIFDPYDVQWALTTRFRPDLDLILIPGVRCHPGDPTSKQFYDSALRDNGLACKAIYDATAIFEHKDKFWRPEFMDVDVSEF